METLQTYCYLNTENENRKTAFSHGTRLECIPLLFLCLVHLRNMSIVCSMIYLLHTC